MSGNICKFFQTNTCRFGDRCRFRHVFEEPQQFYDATRNKQSGVSILKGGGSLTKTNYFPQANNDIDLKRFTEEVALAVKAIDDQGIWPLSCFGCIQSCGNLDGFDDFSPEELRWKAYEARATGKFPAYIEETQVMLKKAAAVRSVFIGKGPTATSILNTYIINGMKREPASAQPNVNAYANSQPIFSQQQNVSSFGFNNQPQTSTFSSNIFAQALNEGVSEMKNNSFGQPFQRNIFGQAVMENQEQVSSFGQQHPPDGGNDFFKQNIFANALQSSQLNSGSHFYQPQPSNNLPSFPQHSFTPQGNSKQVSVNVLYSHIEDLNAEEMEQYKATTFTYGKTPLKPPPNELC